MFVFFCMVSQTSMIDNDNITDKQVDQVSLSNLVVQNQNTRSKKRTMNAMYEDYVDNFNEEKSNMTILAKDDVPETRILTIQDRNKRQYVRNQNLIDQLKQKSESNRNTYDLQMEVESNEQPQMSHDATVMIDTESKTGEESQEDQKSEDEENSSSHQYILGGRLLLTFSALPIDASPFKSICNKIFDVYFTLIKEMYEKNVEEKQTIAARLVAELYPDRAKNNPKYPTIASRSHIHLLFWKTNGRNFGISKRGKNIGLFYKKFHQYVQYEAQNTTSLKEYRFKPNVREYKIWEDQVLEEDISQSTHYPPDDENDSKQVELIRKAIEEYEELRYNSRELPQELTSFVEANNYRKFRFYLYEIKSKNPDYDVFRSKCIHKILGLDWASDDYKIWNKHYAVNKNGQIYNMITKNMLRGSRQQEGYVQIKLSGGRKMVLHKIIAEVWIGQPPPGTLCIRHKNGNLDDNRAINLEYTASKQKTRRKRREQTQSQDTNQPNITQFFTKKSNAEKQRLKRARKSKRKEQLEMLGDLTGEERAQKLRSMDDKSLPYETSEWIEIAEKYGPRKSWDDVKVQKRIKNEIRTFYNYTITQTHRLESFLKWCSEQASECKSTERRNHDEITAHDKVVEVFQLRTLVRRNEVEWLHAVAKWIDLALQNDKTGTKSKNIWIYGPSNIGKTEHVTKRIQKEFPVWLIERSTNICNPPPPNACFTIIEEAQNIQRKDIQKFKALTDQSPEPKIIRVFCMYFFLFVFNKIFFVILLDDCKEVVVPPLIVCSNFSIETWFRDEQKCNEKDIASIKKRFLEINANEEAKYGLYWQDYSISEIRSGQKFNLSNEIYAKVMKNPQNFRLDDYEQASIKIIAKKELEKEWKKLQESGVIPSEIPEKLKKAGATDTIPLKDHYKAWSESYENARELQEKPINAAEYQELYMNEEFVNIDENDNESNRNIIDMTD